MMKRVLKIGTVVAVCAILQACGEKEKKPQPQTEASQSKSLVTRSDESEGLERNWEPYRSDASSVRRKGDRLPRGRRFAQEISMSPPLQTIPVSHMVTLPVTVRNTSREAWKTANNPEEKQPVNLAYHWIEGETIRKNPISDDVLDEQERSHREQGETIRGNPRSDSTAWRSRLQRSRVMPTRALQKSGKVVVFGGLRTPLPYDVPPGETVTLNAKIQAPDRAGKFTLRVTMVKESVTWFEDRGAQPLDIPVEVTTVQ